MMDFPRHSDHQLEETTGNVITGVYGNKALPSPPVDPVTLKTTLTDFTVAVAASAQGGVHATNEKNKKRHELIGLLHQLALYVLANCNNDLATLTSSGFKAATTTRTKVPLSKPVITGVDNGHSGQLVLKAPKVPTAKSFEVEVATVNGGTIGPWQRGGVFTNSRRMIVAGLTPATMYTVHVRAVGGTTGYSDWSDPVTHMCM
jgi:Fibronectin type III domain